MNINSNISMISSQKFFCICPCQSDSTTAWCDTNAWKWVQNAFKSHGHYTHWRMQTMQQSSKATHTMAGYWDVPTSLGYRFRIHQQNTRAKKFWSSVRG